MNKLFLFALIAAATMIMSTGRLLSENSPYPPKNVSAEATYERNIPGILLKWQADERDPLADFFQIYIANEHSDDPSDFKFLTRIRADKNVLDYNYFIPVNNYGKYSIYVTSVVHENGVAYESDPSEIVQTEIDSKPMVSIFSQPKNEAIINTKYSYQVQANTNVRCPVNYEFISEAPKGMTIDKETGLIKWIPTELGTYEIEVRAYSTCEKEAFDIQKFHINVVDEKPFVKLGEIHIPFLHVGESITIKLEAYSNVKCPIKFELLTKTKEVVLDEEHGIITITPVKEGLINFVIKAYLVCDPKIFDVAEYNIKVGKDDWDPCGFVFGVATYNDNTLVQEALVRAWLVDKNPNNPPVFTTKIDNGNYKLNLPEGNYYLTIEGKDFYKQWYHNARTMREAKVITVKCDTKEQYDFFVERYKKPDFYKVTGKVLDEETKEPVLAMVEFFAVEKLYNRIDNAEGRFITRTDEKGNYSISLPNTYTYIAHAVSMMNSIMYIPEYFDDVQSPMEAKILELNKDIEDVNFFLKRKATQLGGFPGKVKDEEGNGLHSFVVAYLVEPQDGEHNLRGFKRTIETNEEGEFRFDNLVYGKYIVLSVPTDRAYLPGYYNNNDIVVQKWRDSKLINVGKNMLDIIFGFTHQLREGRGGIMKLKGRVIERGGAIGKVDGILETGTPLAGSLVYIKDNNGLITDYTFSNEKGDFELSEIGQGDYSLNVDLVGYDSYEGSIESDYSLGALDDLTIMLSQQTTSVDELVNLPGMNVYPQPASSEVSISFNASSAVSNVQIVNSYGSIVSNFNAQTPSSNAIIRFDTSNLPSGAYFIKVLSGTKVFVSPLSIVR